MRRTLLSKLAVSGSVLALGLGAVGCEVDDPADPGVEEEDPLLEDEGVEDDGLEDDGLEDDGLEDDAG